MRHAVIIGLCTAVIMIMLLNIPAVTAAIDIYPSTEGGLYKDVFDECNRVYASGVADFASDIWVLVDRQDRAWTFGDEFLAWSPIGKGPTVALTFVGKVIWDSAKRGKWDLVLDVDQDGEYSSGDVLLGKETTKYAFEVRANACPQFPLGATLEIGLALGIVFIWLKKRARQKSVDRLGKAD